MGCRSLVAPYLCLCSFCLCSPKPARAASEAADATFWVRGVQLLSFARDNGRRDFAATVGLNLPWELLWAQAAAPPVSPESSRAPNAGERMTTDAASVPPKADPIAALRQPAQRQRPARAGEKAVAPALTPSLVRATLARTYRAQGADEADGRLESLDARSRWSAALPELRLRAARATDESQRLAPTIEDPYRYTRDGGTDVAFEVRLTWRLSGLVFDASEVSVERIRSDRAQRRAELRREVLKLLFAWQRARIVADDVDSMEEERQEAALTQIEAELTLNALTGGWFNERRLLEIETSPKAPRRP